MPARALILGSKMQLSCPHDGQVMSAEVADIAWLPPPDGAPTRASAQLCCLKRGAFDFLDGGPMQEPTGAVEMSITLWALAQLKLLPWLNMISTSNQRALKACLAALAGRKKALHLSKACQAACWWDGQKRSMPPRSAELHVLLMGRCLQQEISEEPSAEPRFWKPR